MTATSTAPRDPVDRGYNVVSSTYPDETASLASAVSWGAIIAGAAAGAALSLILLILGVGLGLSSVSPWSHEGISAESFGVSTIIWLTVTQLLSSAMGGYLAGRLRTRWMDTHTDEVYFRDTAHGFLAWAVASLTTAVLLTSVIGSFLGGGIQAGATVAGGLANTATVAAAGNMDSPDSGPVSYFVDYLFRRGTPPAESASPASEAMPTNVMGSTSSNDTSEVSRIFMNVSRSGVLPPEDVRYVGQLVAQRTGVSQQEAEKRVTESYARAQEKWRDAEVAAKEATDKARKASAYAALWIFISLLCGSFISSLTAVYGGRRRDA